MGLAQFVEMASSANHYTMLSHGRNIQPDEVIPLSEYIAYDGVFQVMLFKEKYRKPEHHKLTLNYMLDYLSIASKYISPRNMEGAVDYAQIQTTGNTCTTPELS